MEKQMPDIWLQEHEASGRFDQCGCRLEAEYAEPGDNGSPAFFMCPLHAAAPDLLAAGKRIIELWDHGNLAGAVHNLQRLIDKITEASS